MARLWFPVVPGGSRRTVVPPETGGSRVPPPYGAGTTRGEPPGHPDHTHWFPPNRNHTSVLENHHQEDHR